MNELNKPETIAKLPSSKVFSEDGCLHQPSITITAKFATISYSEIESHGPAASPLGFPAPIGKKRNTLYIFLTNIRL